MLEAIALMIEQTSPDYMRRAIAHFKRASAPVARRQAALEQAAASIYREAAELLRQRIAATPPEEWEKTDRLRAMQRRATRLMQEAGRRLNLIARRSWRDATRENLNRIETVNRGTGDVRGARFGAVSPEEAEATVRDVVKYMQDPLNRKEPLSTSIWDAHKGAPAEIRRQLQLGLLLGENGQQMGQRVYQYLADPKGTSRQLGTVRALRTRARKARDAGEKDKAARLFQSAREKQATLPAGQGRGVYRSPARNAMRLVRGEFKAAERASTISYAKTHRWVGGIRWVLSRAHPEPDVCDPLVGVYTPSTLPEVPHPHCLCGFLLVPKRRIEEENLKFDSPPLEYAPLAA
jgi:hypothetical protein